MVEAIKEGFRAINRNLPLPLIHVVVAVISFIAFILIVGIPVAIAIIYLGIDTARFKEVLSTIRDPLEFLREYLGLTILLITSFTLYLAAITSLSLFTFGGTLAIIKDSFKDPGLKFSFGKFISEGKRYFMQLCWLTFILGIFFLILIFFLGGIVGASIVLLAPYKDEMGIFLIILAILSGLALMVFALIGFLILLALSIYAVIAVVVENLNAWQAIKRAYSFMKRKFIEAIGFYLLLIVGYMGAVILIAMLNLPFSMMPVIGLILTLPTQLVTYIIQMYLGLVMMASIVVFYVRKYAPSPPSTQREDN